MTPMKCCIVLLGGSEHVHPAPQSWCGIGILSSPNWAILLRMATVRLSSVWWCCCYRKWLLLSLALSWSSPNFSEFSKSEVVTLNYIWNFSQLLYYEPACCTFGRKQTDWHSTARLSFVTANFRVSWFFHSVQKNKKSEQLRSSKWSWWSSGICSLTLHHRLLWPSSNSCCSLLYNVAESFAHTKIVYNLAESFMHSKIIYNLAESFMHSKIVYNLAESFMHTKPYNFIELKPRKKIYVQIGSVFLTKEYTFHRVFYTQKRIWYNFAECFAQKKVYGWFRNQSTCGSHSILPYKLISMNILYYYLCTEDKFIH